MKILIVAAHPDDELLDAGGTIAKHVNDGDSVHCLILGEGMNARSHKSKDRVKELHKQSIKAGKKIGFASQSFEDLPDNRFDSIDLLNIVKIIEKYLKTINPDIVYTHHVNDLNIDHQITNKALITACRPINKYSPNIIFSFETLSSTEWQDIKSTQFNPNFYVDIKEYFSKKLDALSEYKTEINKYPHPRSMKGVEILTRYRGMNVNLEFAEAFELLRWIK